MYEFNEADQRCSLDLIDQYIDSLGARSNVDPEKLPWDALRALLSETLYGGKVDNDFDAKILSSLVNYFFSPRSFDTDFPLFHSKNRS